MRKVIVALARSDREVFDPELVPMPLMAEPTEEEWDGEAQYHLVMSARFLLGIPKGVSCASGVYDGNPMEDAYGLSVGEFVDALYERWKSARKRFLNIRRMQDA